ncbi:alpha-glucosidase C-terminal domain-containing protein [Rhizobium sp. RCAM05350]|nr:alpha-glucosidase C-terminal domain-containing protein [Rhizobium sp. RCAM05350]
MLGFERKFGNETILCLFNMSAEPVTTSQPVEKLDVLRRPRLRIGIDQRQYHATGLERLFRPDGLTRSSRFAQMSRPKTRE